MEEWERLKASRALTDEELAQADTLYARIIEAYACGLLTEDEYTELASRLSDALYGDVAEYSDHVAWNRLIASGYFAPEETADDSEAGDVQLMNAAVPLAVSTDASASSAQQINAEGGTNQTEDSKVIISKTIAGTELENVFDITLTVQTEQQISEVYTEPDMAVVIVMDISNTMTYKFGTSYKTEDGWNTDSSVRYVAAMEAAKAFLTTFAESAAGISKVGFVAFNTSAHKIFDLQTCDTADKATELYNTAKSGTYAQMSGSYGSSHERFTNIEAGLKMGADMLAGATNKNKYIILLTDGFPTTYISSGYNGYDPYTEKETPGTDGVFYDAVLKKYCLYGTSYSDKAAIRAREKAAAIKSKGVKIFSIGVDVGGQTIQKYITSSESVNGYSLVDRTGTTYEIGDASSSTSYKNWLQNKIGSGYYYDSTDSAGLKDAYAQIFAKIRELNEEAASAEWVAEDPLPVMGDTAVTTVEFIGMYDQSGNLKPSLSATEGSESPDENTAAYSSATISWDLKNSKYTTQVSGGTTTYFYSLTYRVRLQNEKTVFVENQVYATNGTTTLTYHYFKTENGSTTTSSGTLAFPIPSVHGYLGELSFAKVDQRGSPVPGAVFTLSHDTGQCSVCHGDGTATTMPTYTATSDKDGVVSFSGIPSGHVYTLTETGLPPGAVQGQSHTYTVTIAYDQVTVSPEITSGQVVNQLTELSITKKMAANSVSTDAEREFGFTMVVTDKDGHGVSGSYNTICNNIEGTITLTENGVGSFMLKPGQTLTIRGLPEGSNAVITETDADGYAVYSKQGDVTTSGTVAQVTVGASSGVTFVNKSMAEMPSTGGAGTSMYTWAGLMLCALSGLMYSQKKRRRGGDSYS